MPREGALDVEVCIDAVCDRDALAADTAQLQVGGRGVSVARDGTTLSFNASAIDRLADGSIGAWRVTVRDASSAVLYEGTRTPVWGSVEVCGTRCPRAELGL